MVIAMIATYRCVRSDILGSVPGLIQQHGTVRRRAAPAEGDSGSASARTGIFPWALSRWEPELLPMLLLRRSAASVDESGQRPCAPRHTAFVVAIPAPEHS